VIHAGIRLSNRRYRWSERSVPPLILFVEYVGDYDHQQPAQQVDGGGAWRFTKNQQLDFHVGVGLNRASVDHYFGIGYSFRLDGLFGGTVGLSP
jgi:hypothetical protein